MRKNEIMNIDGVDYNEILQRCVAEIRSAHIAIAKRVNAGLMQVYWNIGKLLAEKKVAEGYGSGVVLRLSSDLKEEFPDMGFSPRNLWEMKRFYERYCRADIKLQQAVAVLPWGHNLLLMTKISDTEEAYYYAEMSNRMGWSRDILLNYIKADAYKRRAIEPKSHNFTKISAGKPTRFSRGMEVPRLQAISGRGLAKQGRGANSAIVIPASLVSKKIYVVLSQFFG